MIRSRAFRHSGPAATVLLPSVLLLSVLLLSVLATGCTGTVTRDAQEPLTDEGSIASANAASASASASGPASASAGRAAGRAGGSATAPRTAGSTGTATAGAEPAPSGPADVDVLITYGGYVPASGTVEVGGIVEGIVEPDGRCTLTLTRAGAAAVRVQRAATPDVRSTACGGLVLQRAQLSPGPWTARLGYDSPHSAGSSAPMTIDVP